MFLFRKIIFLIFVLASFQVLGKTVDIIVNVPAATPDQSTIFLTGNIEQLCQWKPDCIKLKEIFPRIFKATIEVPDGFSQLEYKITRGSWETEAADSYSNPYSNYKINLSEVSTLKSEWVHQIIHWKDLSKMQKQKEVVFEKLFFSNGLKRNKKIMVYVPFDYFKSSESHKKYPVIYVHDGQNVFDPMTSTLGIEWGLDESVTRLSQMGKINKAIVVAITTTPETRMKEYDYDFEGRDYARFVVNEIIPFIDDNFRTISNRSGRYLMGSSMGSIISVMMAIDYPTIFSKVAAISIPASIHQETIFRFLSKYSNSTPNFMLYMDHGDSGIDAQYGVSARKFYQRLLQMGMKEENINYRIFPYAIHTEADWARRIDFPLFYLIGNR